MDTFWLTTAARHFLSARSTYKISISNKPRAFVGCDVCLGPEGNISRAALKHLVREPDIYRKTSN
jgi:hypothetical protein